MDTIIHRIIVEVRFVPILKFQELVYNYLQDHLHSYGGMNEKGNRIELINQANTNSLFCDRTSAGLSLENEPDTDQVNTELDRLSGLLSSCDPGTYHRVGVRVMHLLPLVDISKKDAITKYMESHLIADNQIIEKPKINDFAIVLEGELSNYKYRIETGVMDSSEINTKLSVFTYSGKTDLAVLIDIDLYKETLTKIPSKSSIQKMLQESKDIVKRSKDRIYGCFS